MSNIYAVQSEKGIVKEVNQDSVALKVLETQSGEATLIVLCDGMGGFEKGELASATVTNVFLKWFQDDFKYLVDDLSFDDLKAQWNYQIQNINKKILDYGRVNRIDLGTTVTVLLLYKGNYYICHVGDSRIYMIRDENISQLTEDHTLVAKYVKEGKISPDETESHPERNVLMQCVGASSRVVPQFETGYFNKNDVYILCSDGFRHEIAQNEMMETFKPEIINSNNEISVNINRLIERAEMRKEEDNITVAVIKIA
ncbi:MAG: PP2C family protein-serine/threonine phosphatase [Ruminococcus sp.]